MGDLLSLVQGQLKSGYRPVKVTGSAARGGMYHILDPNGEIVKEGGKPIGFIDKPGFGYRRNSISSLRRAGVLQPRQKRTNTPKDHEKVHTPPPKKPTALAEAILHDAYATPRERKMAREYLNVTVRLDETSHALQLANRRNDELADLIRRHLYERGNQSPSQARNQNRTTASG